MRYSEGDTIWRGTYYWIHVNSHPHRYFRLILILSIHFIVFLLIQVLTFQEVLHYNSMYVRFSLLPSPLHMQLILDHELFNVHNFSNCAIWNMFITVVNQVCSSKEPVKYVLCCLQKSENPAGLVRPLSPTSLSIRYLLPPCHSTLHSLNYW